MFRDDCCFVIACIATLLHHSTSDDTGSTSRAGVASISGGG
jgi:hypothetical protein